jgi:putative ABC transport system substrate-binding protein
MTHRRQFLATVGAGSMAIAFGAHAQVQGRVRRIGYLASADPATTGDLGDAFREGLREHGYVEGQNIAIEYRWTEGALERLPKLAAELVRLNVDLIFAWATAAAIAAKRATSTLPIVFVSVADPVASGLVASLARPGANVTGVSNISRDLMDKLMELLVQVVPGISRVAAVRNAPNPSSPLLLQATETAARSLGLQLQVVDVHAPEDFETAFTTIAAAHAMGVVVIPDPMYFSQRQRIADLALKNRLPTVFARRENAEAGGLISYGPSLPDQIRHATSYVDKIFKGAKPADLPVEQPTKFELAINLKTARALGLTIPQSLLLRADKVIQ